MTLWPTQSTDQNRLLRISCLAALLPLLAACLHAPARTAPAETSHALEDPRTTAWGRQFLDQSASHDNKSGFHVLQAGVDGFAARVQLARRAERTLDLQYFIYRGDTTGDLITAELRRAAERGVRVRVLVDDGDTTWGDEKVLALDGYRGIQVRVFNPFDYRGHNRLVRNLDFVLHKSRLDYRMHNKLMVADNAVALIGGRNIGNQYFQVDPSSQYADDDVFTVGPLVPALSKSFDEFWNSDLVRPAMQLRKPRARHKAAPVETPTDFVVRADSAEPVNSLLSEPGQLTWADGSVLYDSPDKKRVQRREQRGRLMSQTVEHEISATRQDLEIASPYFVPSDHEFDLLIAARSHTVKVRVLTNSLESAPEVAAHSGYQKVRTPLLKSGVQLYEVRSRLDSTRGSGQGRRISQFGNYALHGKMYVFDDRRVLLGSWNYDQRSLRINTEIGVLVDSPVMARSVVNRFDAMVRPEAAYEVVLHEGDGSKSSLSWVTVMDHQRRELTTEPSRGWWKRLKARLLMLLPLDGEL